MDVPSLEFCKELPKVVSASFFMCWLGCSHRSLSTGSIFSLDKELHAHLNGSLSHLTMQTLIRDKASRNYTSHADLQQWQTVIKKGERRELGE